MKPINKENLLSIGFNMDNYGGYNYVCDISLWKEYANVYNEVEIEVYPANEGMPHEHLLRVYIDDPYKYPKDKCSDELYVYSIEDVSYIVNSIKDIRDLDFVKSKHVLLSVQPEYLKINTAIAQRMKEEIQRDNLKRYESCFSSMMRF